MEDDDDDEDDSPKSIDEDDTLSQATTKKVGRPKLQDLWTRVLSFKSDDIDNIKLY